MPVAPAGPPTVQNPRPKDCALFAQTSSVRLLPNNVADHLPLLLV
jgi:hypothetical protein